MGAGVGGVGQKARPTGDRRVAGQVAARSSGETRHQPRQIVHRGVAVADEQDLVLARRWRATRTTSAAGAAGPLQPAAPTFALPFSFGRTALADGQAKYGEVPEGHLVAAMVLSKSPVEGLSKKERKAALSSRISRDRSLPCSLPAASLTSASVVRSAAPPPARGAR